MGTPQHIQDKATRDLARIKPIALGWLAKNTNQENWPEDDWHSIEENWDINIWLYPETAESNDRAAQKATLYYVVNGNTLVNFHFEIQ